MGLRDLFERLRGADAEQYTLHFLEAPEAVRVLETDGEYVRVRLKSAYLKKLRRWADKFYPAVHARFEMTSKGKDPRQVLCVIAPEEPFAEMDPAHLERVITVNRLLLGPVPFRGDLTMNIGLFSVPSVNLAKPYLELLGKLTESGTVGLLGPAAKFIEPIRQGAESIFSSADVGLEIGLSRTDTTVKAGHWVIARVPKADFPQGLTLDPNDFTLLKGGRPLKDFPYMVVSVEGVAARDNYLTIPEISAAWDALKEAAAAGRPDEEVKSLFQQLRRTVVLSPELVQKDRRRIIDLLAKDIEEAGYELGTAAAPRTGALEAVNANARRPLKDLATLLAPMSAGAGVLEAVDASLEPVSHCDDTHDHEEGAAPHARVAMRARGLEAVAMGWRVALSLKKLRAQVDAAASRRSKASDGTIGDAAHRTRDSDHNPWVENGGVGVVTAMDITHDPAGQCDAGALAASLIESRDPRIKYIIWNRQICSSVQSPWTWRPYTGRNPHDKHVHISVLPDVARYDGEADWKFRLA